MSALPPLSLYLHFPWCVSKCPYCDFNSHALRGDLPEQRYVAALVADLAAQVARLDDERPLTSIFMGGGTPSLFTPASIASLLDATRSLLPFMADIEITLEANPGTIERGRFEGYRQAGVNRVSLGAQSFDSEQLRRLGRIHSPDETRRAAEELHAAGLANFNVDLMFALPGQSPEAAERDVAAALALAPRHLSHYQLTLEPGTVFAAEPPPDLPTEDSAIEALQRCQQRLSAAGFERYEVSAYAQDGARCQHNLNYWAFGDYLGVGAGAHGKLSWIDAGESLQIERTTAWREPRRYLAEQPAVLARTRVAAAQRPFEFMLNGLRLTDGFTIDQFERRSGLGWERVAAAIDRLAAQGLVEIDRRAAAAATRIRPGERGLAFLNTALLEFLPESSSTTIT